MVEGGEAIISASEDEAMEVEHLLAETKFENAVVDEIIYMNSDDTEKYLTLENFPCSEEFGSTHADFGISNAEASESHGQFLDSILQDHDEGQSLHVIGNVCSDCPDYLLESGLTEESSHLHYGLHSGYHLGNLSLEYPQTLEADSDIGETLDVTNTISSRADGASHQNDCYLDNTSFREFHDPFRSTSGQGTPVLDKQQMKQCILFGLSSLMDMDDTSNNLESGLLLDESDDMIFFSTNNLSETSCGSLTNTIDQKISVDKLLNKKYADKDTVSANCLGTGRLRLIELEGREHALVSRKRMRKPTRRYIEESSEVKSRLCTEKIESPSISPPNKILHVRSHDILWKRSGSTQLICSEKSSTLSSSPKTYIVQPRRGRPRKNFTCVVKDLKGKKGHMQNAVEQKIICGSVLSKSINEYDTLDCAPTTQSDRCGVRRKHHRLWSLIEVTKLIEGVSRYGVGRWTDIKRLLFSSSAYRTSVDLKDKWRNLLRASGVHTHGEKEFGARKKHLPGLVPQSVLRRVRDLAIIHPYPRERKTRVPMLAPVNANGKETPPCSKRTVNKRNST